jgi:P27 family predicted phage terminase small subunit
MPRKLQAIKRITGTYRPKAVKKPFPVELANFDELPVELNGNDAAVIVWERYKPHLEKIGIAAVDLPMVAAFCIEFSTNLSCKAELAKTGYTYTAANGIPTPRPEVRIARDSFDRAVRLAAKFGLVLSDRQKLDPREAKQPDNPFEKLRDDH